MIKRKGKTEKNEIGYKARNRSRKKEKKKRKKDMHGSKQTISEGLLYPTITKNDSYLKQSRCFQHSELYLRHD